jgi:DNA polymerase III delta subunit
MPLASAADVRKQVAQRRPSPVYLIFGCDEVEAAKLASDISGLVDESLRAFNLERLYASDRSVTGTSIVEAARQLPLMSSHRVVTVLRAEKLLKPKRRGAGKGDDEGAAGDEPASADAEALEAYLRSPEPSTVLVLVAADVDRSRRLYKQLQKTATMVECRGLMPPKEDRYADLNAIGRQAEKLVLDEAGKAGVKIDPAAARLLAKRAGTDINTLRGDLERLLLYAAGKPRISEADAREVVTTESSQDDWAVTNAIQRGQKAEALRQLALALDGGGVPYMILGQIGYFVREKLVTIDPRRVPAAVEAMLRTDLDLKGSAGDHRVLLERLVVELCGSSRPLGGRG